VVPKLDRIGRYSVERRLGSGAFARVWLGHDEVLDAPVAIKVLAENWADQLDLRARFVEEARVLRRADSDRVVRVFDIGDLPDGRPYFVMTYADRGTLEERLDGDAPLPVAEALRMAEQVARGVAVVHGLGVIHRDLKPSNVLFRSTVDGRERLLIADLGLSKALAHASGFTVAAGSPGYMAPEQQVVGGGIDVRVDVYGIGAIAYRMLTGAVPQAGADGLKPPPSALRDGLPEGTDSVLSRALEVDRERRWPSARSLADALAELASRVPAETVEVGDDDEPTVVDVDAQAALEVAESPPAGSPPAGSPPAEAPPAGSPPVGLPPVDAPPAEAFPDTAEPAAEAGAAVIGLADADADADADSDSEDVRDRTMTISRSAVLASPAKSRVRQVDRDRPDAGPPTDPRMPAAAAAPAVRPGWGSAHPPVGYRSGEPPAAPRPPARRRRRWPWLTALVAVVGLAAGGAAVVLIRGYLTTTTVQDSTGQLTVTVPASWAGQVQNDGWSPKAAGFGNETNAAGLAVATNLTEWRDPARSSPGVFVGASRDAALVQKVGQVQHTGCTKTSVGYSHDGLTGTIYRHACPGPASFAEVGLTRQGSAIAWYVQIKQPSGEDHTTQILDTLRVTA
jgi:tRNA A-37 threonylcarbamoyl transferase component Bud32